MCVLLFGVFKHLLQEKTDVLKTCQKIKFLRKKSFKKCTHFEEQKGTSYTNGNVYFGIIDFSCLSSTKTCLRLFLICFAREIRDFYQSFLGNFFPIYLAKN